MYTLDIYLFLQAFNLCILLYFLLHFADWNFPISRSNCLVFRNKSVAQRLSDIINHVRNIKSSRLWMQKAMIKSAKGVAFVISELPVPRWYSGTCNLRCVSCVCITDNSLHIAILSYIILDSYKDGRRVAIKRTISSNKPAVHKVQKSKREIKDRLLQDASKATLAS